jgi:iron(III) transport system permease protein
MRPFNFDTLAVQAHRLASDERLNEAAVPSLVIMVIGLLPVILVCRRIAGPKRARLVAASPTPSVRATD